MTLSQPLLNIAEICARHGLKDLILSPGSRNAPLTLAFTRHPNFETKVISDERSAGFIALGMAQHLKKPVILLCTSGTAVLNYSPAVAEAYYQGIPLLVITADRPPEWIDQKDGQTLRQNRIFEPHIKKSFELPVSAGHKDATWHIGRIVNEAILITSMDHPGPVHINVPLREPLYPQPEDPWTYDSSVQLIGRKSARQELAAAHWEHLMDQWHRTAKKLIVGGQYYASPALHQALGSLATNGVPVIGDAVSNLHTLPGIVSHPEIILGQPNDKLQALRPELLVTFGGSVVSKNLKLFLRNHPATIHWHLEPHGIPADTFQSLTDIIPMNAEDFFLALNERVAEAGDASWPDLWIREEQTARKFLDDFTEGMAFNEFQVVRWILQELPPGKLHLANSMPVRWADLCGIPPGDTKVYCNRGVSGIDGSNGCAAGHALAGAEVNVLLTGDMAFLYDRNAFWHEYPLPNLKVVVLNNHGGGIFRLIDGPRQQPELEEFFVTRQTRSAEQVAKENNFKYLYCRSAEEFKESINQLWEDHDRAAVLEVDLPEPIDPVYQELKQRIRNNYE